MKNKPIHRPEILTPAKDIKTVMQSDGIAIIQTRNNSVPSTELDSYRTILGVKRFNHLLSLLKKPVNRMNDPVTRQKELRNTFCIAHAFDCDGTLESSRLGDGYPEAFFRPGPAQLLKQGLNETGFFVIPTAAHGYRCLSMAGSMQGQIDISRIPWIPENGGKAIIPFMENGELHWVIYKKR